MNLPAAEAGPLFGGGRPSPPTTSPSPVAEELAVSSSQTLAFLFAVLPASALLLGCGGASRQEPPQTPAARQEPAVDLQVVAYSQLEQAIQAQRGRIVVLDVWASWCLPCKQEFPHLVELHRRYARRGVTCLSVSLDEPAQHATALAFLRQQKATFPNYLLNESEKSFDLLDLKGIPAVFVYDRRGQLVRRFTGDDPDHQFTYADVERLVQELLQKEDQK